MLFAPKPKGFFIDVAEETILLARANMGSGPCVVEDLVEVPAGDKDAWAGILSRFMPKKASNALLQAVCGVYPARRVVRRATLDLKMVKDSAYLNELLRTQFRIDPAQYTLTLLHPFEGTDYDPATASQPEVAVCGLPAEEVSSLQTALLDRGIYPDRLELGSVATIGGLSDYLRHQSTASPTLFLELGRSVTHSYIVSPRGFEAARTIPEGLDAMVPVVQKELGLKDPEAAKKLFYSNTFDFTGMGPALVRRLLRELQSSIGFFEVQTGQSVGRIMCTHLPSDLAWLEGTLSSQLGVAPLSPDLPAWLQSRDITLGESLRDTELSSRWFGLFCLIAHYHGAS